MAEGVGIAPTSAHADPVFKTGAASLYLPAFREIGCQTWTRTKVLADGHQRLNPDSSGLLGHYLAMALPVPIRSGHRSV